MRKEEPIEIKEITSGILKDYQKGRAVDALDRFHQLDRGILIDITKKLLSVLFPGFYKDGSYKMFHIETGMAVLIEDIAYRLERQIEIALERESGRERAEKAQQIAFDFLRTIPRIRDFLETDVQAAMEGDPAAENVEEIIVSYPGFKAISIHRLAHELYALSVPVIPRIMSEYAHSITGIDIHPGASIGRHFFIDHGTGVVVGETSVIGEHVKVYQGVTIGALSTRGGRKLRNSKRHPTIEDNVTIYSGASILGGDTVIGANSVIGGNVFITQSIPPDTRVSVKSQELRYNRDGHEVDCIDLPDSSETWYYTI